MKADRCFHLLGNAMLALRLLSRGLLGIDVSQRVLPEKPAD